MIDKPLMAANFPQEQKPMIPRESIAVRVTRLSVLDLMQLKGIRTTRVINTRQ